MTRFFALLLAIAPVVVAGDPVDGVREAALGWRQGPIKQDSAALQRYLAEDLVYTHGTASVKVRRSTSPMLQRALLITNRSLKAVRTFVCTARSQFLRA